MPFLMGLLKGRLKKHPIHLMLVHFPSALIPTTLVLDLIGIYTGETSFNTAAGYTLAGGTAAALIAGIFGFIDYLKINAEKPEWKVASRHAILNVLWVITWTGLAAHKLNHDPVAEPVSTVYLIILGVSVAGMIISNYLGGELVLKYDLGKDRYKKR